MKATLSAVAMLAVALFNTSVQAQINCPTPQPTPSSYFLGVYTSTVAVSDPGAGPSDGAVAMVVPGYGEAVYGQRINRIVPNSPAIQAGLEPGDILVNANGISLDSADLLRAAIANSEGYLEMQVLDGRSGELLWVVAATDPQNVAPMFSAVEKNQPTKSVLANKSVQPNKSFQPRRLGPVDPVRSASQVLRRQLPNQLRTQLRGLPRR